MSGWRYRCNHCKQPEPLSDHVNDDGEFEYLCTPCYQIAGYWDSIRPKRETAA